MFKTIVVALDGSEMSDKVIAALDTIEINSQTKIILSHVLASPSTDSELVSDRPCPSREALYQKIAKQLQAYQTMLPGSEIEIVSGDTSEEIIRLANIHRADLIVIGSRGLKGFKRIIEGSVSGQVVADSPCSVLVIKP